MNRNSENEWLKDFKDFVDAKDTVVPKEISQKILQRVHSALNPAPRMVFAKVLGIHSVVSTLSLSVCNQFGMNPFHTGFSLSDFFMKFGHSACMTICGFLFVGLSIGFARILLKPEEFLVLRKNYFIQVFVLSLLSLATFIAFGAEILVGIGLLWVAGALLGGLVPILITNKRPFVSY